MKILKKSLSYILALLMMLTAVQSVMPVFAEEITADISQTENEEIKVIAESEELRTENSKTYVMSDGSFKMDIYSHPVFVQDEDGNWVEREVSSGTRKKAKGSNLEYNEIRGTYVSSEETNLNFSRENEILVNADCTALLSPEALTELKTNFHIISAIMNLPVNYADDNAKVYAYNIAEGWNMSTVTYSDMPQYDQLIDHCIVEDTVSIDITKYINSSDFYGIALTSDDEVSLSKSSDEPIYTISFIVTTGIDEDFEYTTFDMGSAGDVYINKQSGNLIVKRNDISTGSGEHSFDLTSAFNSITTLLSDKKWFLNCDTALVFLGLFYIDDTVSVNIFTNTEIDDDGYQILEDNKYGFEKKKPIRRNDYDIPLIFGNGHVAHINLNLPDMYEIIAENGTLKYYFAADSGLIGINEVDEDGNETAVFAKEKINNNTVRITDGDCNTLTIVTNTTNITISARDSEGNITDTEILTLDENSNVTSVTVNNETIAEYEYDNINRLICILNEDKALSFNYEGSTASVNNIEYKKNNEILEKYEYNRSENICTEQFSGNDSIFNNEDDTVVTYTFDKNCRVISTEIKDIYGKSCGSLAYGYKDKEISNVSYTGKYNTNHISNSSFENANDWQSTGNVTYTSNEANTGMCSVILNRTASVNQTVSAADLGGKAMVASAYVKANEEADGYIKTDLICENNIYTYTGERIADTDNEWERITNAFVVPEGCTEIKTSIIINDGMVCVDSACLEEGYVPEKYNQIENTAFEITGNIHSENIAFEDVYLTNASQSDTYILSGNATAHSLPTNESKKYALKVEIYYNNSDVTKTVRIDYSSYNSEKQYGQIGFNLATDNENLVPCRIRIIADYSYNHGTAVFENISLIKSSYVIETDENNVVETEDDLTTYNDDGTIATYTDSEGNVTTYLYSDGKLVSVETKNSNNEITYHAEYNSDENIVSEQSEGLTTTYTYSEDKLFRFETKDGDNNITAYTEYDNDGNISVEYSDEQFTYYSYYPDGSINMVLTGDENGNPVYGEEYSEDGYLVQCFSDGIYYGYTYDENGNVLSKTYGELNFEDLNNFEIINTKTVNYIYENNRCTTVNCNGFEYTYSYDDFGNTSSLSVNRQTLENREYYCNGLIKSKQYGNNDSEHFSYDIFGNVTEVIKGNTVYSDYYNSTNSKCMSVENQEKARLLKYDDNGRYCGENVISYDNNSYSELYRYRMYFNDDSVTKTTLTTENTKITNTYSSSNSTSTAQFGNIVVTSTYDEDETLQSKTGAVNESFTYNDKGLISTHTIGNDTYSYEYNDKGNITGESKNNTVIKSYSYDTFGHLIREDNLDTNTSVLYNYDNGGNILSKDIYPYSTGDLGEATETVTYTYDNGWKDLLTSFNGESISYDSIGNPTTYRGAVCTYSGRQLQSFTKNGTSISYKYDENGLRTSKTVNGIQHDYYYIDDVLMHEKVGNDYELFYRYDADGNLVLITRINLIDNTSEDFTVIANIQGDIIELLNTNLEVVATYTYDAWGNITITSTDSIASQNSIRYRGYVYDNETGLYYLQSRYYDPETGRFINCDNPDYIGVNDTFAGWNGFAYCENDWVNYVDFSGLIAQKSNRNYNIYVYFYDKNTVPNYGHIDISIDGKNIYSFGTFLNVVVDNKKEKLEETPYGALKTYVYNTYGGFFGKYSKKLSLKVSKEEYQSFMLYFSMFQITWTDLKGVEIKGNLSPFSKYGSKISSLKEFKIIRGDYTLYSMTKASCAIFVKDALISCLKNRLSLFDQLISKLYITPESVYKFAKKIGEKK